MESESNGAAPKKVGHREKKKKLEGSWMVGEERGSLRHWRLRGKKEKQGETLP